MSERCDTCAHRRGYHYQGVTECAFVNDEQDCCRCQRFIPMAAAPPRPAAPDATAGDGLREVLRKHHPIMRSETGPFSGCRCGAVKLGQDVIAHVVAELRAALDGTP